MASIVVDAGITAKGLADFIPNLLPEYVVPFLNWCRQDMEMRLLARELKEATHRMAELVTAVKGYSYMDQEHGLVSVDLNQGIRDTIMIMTHKLKQKNIQVHLELATDLPMVSAYGSELNQVWTNILDNAIDALGSHGTIHMTSYLDAHDPNWVTVEVTDNGSGIPADVLSRIFEPFYTTKAVGKGTGMGLEIVHRIVTTQHQGRISVRSVPGHTVFKVCLPVQLQVANAPVSTPVQAAI
jgi:signal transduction histidine kinase